MIARKCLVPLSQLMTGHSQVSKIREAALTPERPATGRRDNRMSALIIIMQLKYQTRSSGITRTAQMSQQPTKSQVALLIVLGLVQVIRQK